MPTIDSTRQVTRSVEAVLEQVVRWPPRRRSAGRSPGRTCSARGSDAQPLEVPEDPPPQVEQDVLADPAGRAARNGAVGPTTLGARRARQTATERRTEPVAGHRGGMPSSMATPPAAGRPGRPRLLTSEQERCDDASARRCGRSSDLSSARLRDRAAGRMRGSTTSSTSARAARRQSSPVGRGRRRSTSWLAVDRRHVGPPPRPPRSPAASGRPARWPAGRGGCPRRAIRPSSSRATRSASCTVDGRCATISAVVLASTRRSAASTAASVCTSSAESGSSSTRTAAGRAPRGPARAAGAGRRTATGPARRSGCPAPTAGRATKSAWRPAAPRPPRRRWRPAAEGRSPARWPRTGPAPRTRWPTCGAQLDQRAVAHVDAVEHASARHVVERGRSAVSVVLPEPVAPTSAIDLAGRAP